MRHRLAYGFVFFCLIALSSGCRTTMQRLGPEEHLVVKNSLEIVNVDPTINKLQLAYGLGGMYRQPPNKKNLFFFRNNVNAWYKHKDRKSRWSKMLMKKFAEAPVIYNDAESQRTAKNMQNFMRQRGYFDARCSYQTAFGNKTAKVKYILDVGQVHLINSVAYRTSDSVLLQILPEIQRESLLKVNQAVSVETFNGEKTRITDKLKNNGFAYFVPNNVEFSGDSSGHKVKVIVELLPPTDSTFHQQVSMDEVVVLNNFVPGFNQMLRDTTLGGLYFVSGEKNFSVKPAIILKAIKLYPGSQFRQIDFDRTYRNLSNLGVFRLVSIKPTRDSVLADKLDLAISLAPNKRVAFGADVDVSQLSGGAQSPRLFGVSTNVFVRNRNLFRGAEHLQINARYGVDLNADNVTFKESPIFSQELKVSGALTIPRFIDYLGLWSTGNRLRLAGRSLITNALYQRMKEDGQAQFSASLASLQFINQFNNQSANLAFGYVLSGQKRNTQYSWNHIGLDVLFVKTQPGFDSILLKNPFLQRSLGDQLFTGFLLRDFSWRYVSNNAASRKKWTLRIAAEQSGFEIAAANWLWNRPYPGVTFQLADSLPFSKYLRLDADYASEYPLGYANGLSLATHAGVSVATPYGNAASVPYVKQVFVGGPNSNRAWRTRELGPGNYISPDAGSISQYYQTGDLRLDLNAELRFDLIYWFKGALFVDAGNIWTLKADDRPGSVITTKFYDQIAVGTGIGLRIDFDYAIIRLDAATKVRNPYQDDTGSHLALKKFSARDFNLNLAIGYPF